MQFELLFLSLLQDFWTRVSVGPLKCAFMDDAAVEAVLRAGQEISLEDAKSLLPGDVLAVTGLVTTLDSAAMNWGTETTAPDGYRLVLENRHIVLTNPDFAGSKLQGIHDHTKSNALHDVFVTGVNRMGRELPLLPNLEIHKGDELQLTGSPRDLNKVQKSIGYPISSAAVTDFIFFGIGMPLEQN